MAEKKNTAKYNLGLIMIVKNESHIIEQALESMLPVIDTYVISDTGSTDDTKEKIVSFFKKHNIPGHVYSDTWRDFGYNRTKVLEHASKHARFGFMLDADDLLKCPEGMNKKSFYKQLEQENVDAYKVTIVNETDSLHYHRTQLFNLKKPWKYEGILHEYPMFNRSMNPKLILLPWKVISRRLGNRNHMDPIIKYKSDADILKQALQQEPMNTRYMFYLAQSYRDAEDYHSAIHWYQVRADFGGWYEEVYFSIYQIGQIYLDKLHNEKEGVNYCLKAFKFHPKRIESMHAIANFYAIRKKDFSIAYQFIRKIKDTPLPKEDGLFVTAPLYEYYALYFYFFMCFLTFRRINVSEDDWNRFPLQIHEGLRDILLLQEIEVLSNTYSINTIPFPSTYIPINTNPVQSSDVFYRTLNPCIALDEDNNIWYNIRCTNFDIHYQSMDRDGLIQTFNFLCNRDFSKVYKLCDVSKYRRTKCHKDARVMGYEDMRLFRFQKKWYFLANNDELALHLNRPQMVLGYLSDKPNTDDCTWNIEYVVHLQFAYQLSIEKNWCPLLSNDASLQIVYSMQPFVLLEPDIVTGYCRIVTNVEYHFKLQGVPHSQPVLRGSTPWIPFQNGWLALGHYVYFMKDLNHQRIYYHFFIYVEKDYNGISVSKPFHFEEHVIEFATGLISYKNNIHVSFSISDSIPKEMIIPISEISKRLVRL